jgi:hypothetical protein
MNNYGFNKDLSRDELIVANNQGIIFEECQDLGVDAIEYVTKFMKCPIAQGLDEMQSGVYSAGAAPLKRYALEMISPVADYDADRHINEDALAWVGYIYRYWNYLLGTPSREIIETIPAVTALECYPAYHCMGNAEAISKMLRAHAPAGTSKWTRPQYELSGLEKEVL